MNLMKMITVKATAQRVPATMTLKEVGPWIFAPEGDPEDIHTADIDMAVTRLSIDGTDDGILTPEEMRSMQIGADGSRRLILCELALGMADPRRSYWKWGEDYPPWVFGTLGRGYAVNLMSSHWRQILKTEVEKINAAGFDGIWLDCAYAVPVDKEMAEFVDEVRQWLGQKVLVAANGEHMVTVPGFDDMVDGLGKTCLYSGEDDPCEAEDYLSSTSKPVFVIERSEFDMEEIDRLRREVSERGWNPCVVTRSGCF